MEYCPSCHAHTSNNDYGYKTQQHPHTEIVDKTLILRPLNPYSTTEKRACVQVVQKHSNECVMAGYAWVGETITPHNTIQNSTIRKSHNFDVKCSWGSLPCLQCYTDGLHAALCQGAIHNCRFEVCRGKSWIAISQHCNEWFSSNCVRWYRVSSPKDDSCQNWTQK